MLTIDTPIRTTRTARWKAASVTLLPFDRALAARCDVLAALDACLDAQRHSALRPSLAPSYGGRDRTSWRRRPFQQREGGGAFTWEEVARYRDKWKKPLVVKGVLHPEDAEKAAALGLDGIVVSNHGGRQIDAQPRPIDILPAIARRLAGAVTIIGDSGMRTGVDVARAIASGPTRPRGRRRSSGASAPSASKAPRI